MQINLLVIRTKNIDALAQFYEQLGVEFEYHRHGNGPMHYSAKLGVTVFEIYPLQKNQIKADDSLRLGFDVEHLNQLLIKLEAANVFIEKEPSLTDWGYQAVIKDLDGRKIALVEKR